MNTQMWNSYLGLELADNVSLYYNSLFLYITYLRLCGFRIAMNTCNIVQTYNAFKMLMYFVLKTIIVILILLIYIYKANGFLSSTTFIVK